MRNISIGIDLGTYTTRAVAISHEKDQDQVIGTVSVQTKGLRHGYVVNAKDATDTIKKVSHLLEKSIGTKVKRALVSIGGITVSSILAQGSTIITKADTEITELDVENAIKVSEDTLPLTNRKIIYKSVIGFKIDGKEVHGRPEGMKGAKLEVRVLFVTCLLQHLEDLESVFFDAGIEIIEILPSSIAAAEVALTPKQKMVGCALLNIGSETVSIAVYDNQSLIGLHVFQIGSSDITNDIALGLKISLEEAEQIKIGSLITTIPRKKLEEIIEARLSDIFELVENYLKKLKRSELLPAGIILTGGGSGLSNIESFSKATLNLPSKIGDAEIITHKGAIRDATWYVAYGLALLSEEYETGGSSHGVFGTTFKKFKKNSSSFFRQFLP